MKAWKRIYLVVIRWILFQDRLCKESISVERNRPARDFSIENPPVFHRDLSKMRHFHRLDRVELIHSNLFVHFYLISPRIIYRTIVQWNSNEVFENVFLPSFGSSHTIRFLSIPDVKSWSNIKKEYITRIERCSFSCYKFNVKFLCTTSTIKSYWMFLKQDRCRRNSSSNWFLL